MSNQIDIFKTINVHHFNPPYGVTKHKGKLKVIHHAFNNSEFKPSIGIKPILFNRFKKREVDSSQCVCTLQLKTEGMRYINSLKTSIISIRYYSSCKRYSFVKYYNAYGQANNFQLRSMGNNYKFYFSGGNSRNFGRYYGRMFTSVRSSDRYTPAMRTVKKR